MREILFRGKRMDNGEWVEGDLFHHSDGKTEMFVAKEVLFAGKYLEGIWRIVDPNTVCQYTGLTDKNGAKIFEGDVIQAEFRRFYKTVTKMKGIVEFHNSAFSILWEDKDYGRSFAGYVDDIEVIGNIYDNDEW